MNIHSPDFDREFTREDAAQALHLLRGWAKGADVTEVETLDPVLRQ